MTDRRSFLKICVGVGVGAFLTPVSALEELATPQIGTPEQYAAFMRTTLQEFLPQLIDCFSANEAPLLSFLFDHGPTPPHDPNTREEKTCP